ncbi:uncharacterized protein [Chelonus insularis]|nr:uncharacterized protein LOC118074696 isoform X2 [Chelonus insularis]
MIALALIIVFVTTFSAGMCFAIIFGEFFESTESGSSMTILNSVFMISFSLSGVMTNALLQKFSLRMVSIGAAVLYSIPNILAAFVTHVYQLAIIFFIQGIGAGLMNTICSANFNAFFVKKRAKIMGAAQVIIGIGGIVYPLLVEKMMSAYGFRGTAALIGAMSLNSIVGMMMMHPVEWHIRDPNEVLKEKRKQNVKKELQDLSSKLSYNPTSLMNSSDRRSTIHVMRNFTELNRWDSLGSLKNNLPHHKSLRMIDSQENESNNTHVESIDRPRSKSMRIPLCESLSVASVSSIASGSSIRNITGALINSQRQVELILKATANESKKTESSELIQNRQIRIVRQKSISQNDEQTFSEMIENLFELSLLKDRTFMIMSVGISFVFLSDFTFSSLLPLAMLQSGYKNSDAAMTITVSAAAELASRILFLILTLFIDVRAKVIFFFAMIVLGFAKFAFFSFGTNLIGILVCTALIGMVRSFILVSQPLVVVENFPVEKYAVCYGIFTLVNGVVMVILGPLVGFIKDITNSFDICQLVLIAINCAFIIPWAIELLMDYRKSKKERKINALL